MRVPVCKRDICVLCLGYACLLGGSVRICTVRVRSQYKQTHCGRATDQSDTLTAEHIAGTPALAAIAYRALTAHPPFASGEIGSPPRVSSAMPSRGQPGSSLGR
jgi:hypothetical protein